MTNYLQTLKETPSQTAGPYVHIGLSPSHVGIDCYAQELGWDITGPNAAGERIRVEGRVLDGTGAPIRDALLEFWQANAAGHYAHPEGGGDVEDGFRGWGRAVTDFDSGLWRIDTIKPGPVTGPKGKPMAPHISVWIVSRGINIGLNTRLYFSDEAEANAKDPTLLLVENAARRKTLVAERSDSADGPVYRFDIHLQGATETVFFDI